MPWVVGSIYHVLVGRYTMDRGIKIPWVGGQYTIGRGSICHG